jgi:hypothetical protein
MKKEWAELTPGEKREERFKRWLSPPDGNFSSPEAGRGYGERVTRFIKAIKLEEPDRVPVMLPAGFFPAYYAGGTLKTVMYECDELKRALLKFLSDFEMDTFADPGLVLPGKMLDSPETPIGRGPEPQDTANAVAFLASDVSADIVGQIICVDGGSTMP